MKYPTHVRPAALVLAIGLALGGCAIAPVPLTRQEQSDIVKADRLEMYKDQEPVSGPIGMDEAMARAVKYNLDGRLKLMEQALAYDRLDASRYDMLPKLTAQAGYDARDNYLVTDSRDVDTGALLLSDATSSQRSHGYGGLSATWNILDFGVSYFQAHEKADEVLIMQERRRKTVQQLMQQVRQAYWQAVGAQQLEGKVAPLLAQVQKALDDSEKVQKEKLRAPLEVLNYQKGLIDLVRQLEAIRDQLDQAKPRLAALMNLQPGVEFSVRAPADLAVPAIGESPTALEDRALLQRPDMAEATLQERVSATEVKVAMARFFPGIELNLGPQYDSNSFLHNHQWTEGGLNVTWNLLNLLAAPSQKAAAEQQVAVSKAQRMALGMAVVTQVDVALRDYAGHRRQYELSSRLFDIDHAISQQTANGAANEADSRLNQIRSGASELMADYRRYDAYAELQSSYGQLVASLGVDPLPQALQAEDIGSLAHAIAERLDATSNPDEAGS